MHRHSEVVASEWAGLSLLSMDVANERLLPDMATGEIIEMT